MSPTLKCYIEQLDKPIASITAADIQEWQYHLVNEGESILVAPQPDGLRPQVLLHERQKPANLRSNTFRSSADEGDFLNCGFDGTGTGSPDIEDCRFRVNAELDEEPGCKQSCPAESAHAVNENSA